MPIHSQRERNAWVLTLIAGGLLTQASLAQVKAQPITDPKGAAPATVPGPKGGAPAPTPPGGGGEPQPVHPLPAVTSDDPDTVTLSAFVEPVALSALVAMVGETLGVNITTIGEVSGTVVFNAPVAVRKSELLPLLESLLEQQAFTMTLDRPGWYTVHAIGNVGPNPGVRGDEALITTRVFRTPNMRPSALKPALDAVLAGGGPGAQPRQYGYLDDLGIIIATDAPKKLDAISGIIDRLIAEYARMDYVRLELSHLSAAVARDRALQLVGQLAQPVGRATAPNDAANGAGNGAAQTQRANGGPPLDNLGDRLMVDQQGNALIFKGTTEEIDQVRRVLDLIDVPNNLVPRAYDAGGSASEVASIAHSRGLGEVVTIADTRSANRNANIFDNRGQNGLQGGSGQLSGLGGPVIVVDEKRGKIVYYGTPSQQEELGALLRELDTQAEQVVLRVYKLRNAKAEDMQEIILGIIQNQTPASGGDLLPGDTRTTRPTRLGSRANANNPASQPRVVQSPASGEEGLSIDSENAFVIADVPNNQVIVKAPAAQQPEFARLIEKLDLRRPQVYIEARIVAITADDKLRTAFETQLINANGTGGVFSQNFGLSTTPTGATGQPILTQRLVAAGLTGFTGAIIRNDQLPIIMTALGNETDSRVIATPQLLVDDNEKAKVATIDSVPTSTINRGTSGQPDLITNSEPATAETSLEVTPHISDGGYLRMEYTVKLEAFTGASVNGLAPPKQTNNINADSITVPSDSTVVIGGLIIDSKSKTVAKIPLLGDIPLIGLLFQDRTTGNRKTALYIFLTPKILREPTFADLKLLTRGPQSAARVAPDYPDLQPSPSQIVWPGAASVPQPAPLPPPQAPATPPPASPAPAAPAPAEHASAPRDNDGPSPD